MFENGYIRKTPGEYIKIGEETYYCCAECGGTGQAWRYQDPKYNTDKGRPQPETIELEVPVTDSQGNIISMARSTYTQWPSTPTEAYYVCHPHAKSKKAQRDVTKWVAGLTEVMCCGEFVECYGFTNTCPTCSADFNMSGHQLAPRHLWGEETGESAADIMMAEAAGFPELED